jgi:hypothetical protein
MRFFSASRVAPAQDRVEQRQRPADEARQPAPRAVRQARDRFVEAQHQHAARRHAARHAFDRARRVRRVVHDAARDHVGEARCAHRQVEEIGAHELQVRERRARAKLLGAFERGAATVDRDDAAARCGEREEGRELRRATAAVEHLRVRRQRGVERAQEGRAPCAIDEPRAVVFGARSRGRGSSDRSLRPRPRAPRAAPRR